MATTKNPNPTKADVVRVLIAKARKDAETRRETFRQEHPALSDVERLGLARLNGEVTALTALYSKVVVYLDRGDMSVLL